MHAVIPVQVEQQRRRALRHMHGGGNLSLTQLLKRASLIQRYGLDVDPQCAEEHRRGDKGTAVAQVEIHLFAGKIGHTGDVLPGQDMHLFLIELFDIRYRRARTGEAAIAEIRQHVGWDDRGIGSSEIEKVDNVLHRTLSGKRSDAQCAGIAELLMRAFDYLRLSARRTNGGDHDERQSCREPRKCRSDRRLSPGPRTARHDTTRAGSAKVPKLSVARGRVIVSSRSLDLD